MLMKERLLLWQSFHLENHEDSGGERIADRFLSRYRLVGGVTPLLPRKPDAGEVELLWRRELRGHRIFPL